jgi:hypothetical protein
LPCLDFDGDGDQDIVFAVQGFNQLHVNLGGAQGGTEGTFELQQGRGISHGFTYFEDLRAQGDDDSTFFGGDSSAVRAVDVDLDGDIDIVFANLKDNDNEQPVMVYLNSGGVAGTFAMLDEGIIATRTGDFEAIVVADLVRVLLCLNSISHVRFAPC